VRNGRFSGEKGESMGEMLVLGDSILWGQGLNEADKATSLLRDAWGAAEQGEVNVHRFAHSGADVWEDGQSGVLAAINPVPPPFPASFPLNDEAILNSPACPPDGFVDYRGEIPGEAPYILRQILDAKANLGATPIDLVLLDGGINDTEVYNLVLPGKSLSAVVARGRSIQPRVAFALNKIGAAFPSAKILVTGYYPVVSEQTRIVELLQFARRVGIAALQEGVTLADDLRLIIERPFEGHLPQAETLSIQAFRAPDPLAPIVWDLAHRCSAWTDAIHAALQQSIAMFNGSRTVAVADFVDPQFGPQHAVFAPETLLWEYVNGQPPDPLAPARSQWCNTRNLGGFERLFVECASMGHPSPLGAKRYADALIAKARALGVF
jgi:hypothetical protein